MPHKELAAGTVDVCRPVAERVQAVNTFWSEDGSVVGDNTDVSGLLEALHSPGIVPACCYCREVQAPDLSWHSLPDGLPLAGTARLSHGICPACWQAVVVEAGGRFTSLDGVDGPFAGNALATNGLLHDQVLTALAP